MSTGNSADKYPALPADLGTGLDDLELAQFNQIVLKACRSNPRMRYRSADELMMALLSFQFNQEDLQRGVRGRSLARTIGVIGAVIGAAFVIFLVWRLVWLMQHAE
jgi:hypothetical protein